MAFTDMNNVEQELGEEKPPDRNGSRNFMILAGILGGIMVLALVCIAALALFRYLPGQRAAQSANATNEAQATAIGIAASRTASAPIVTRTLPPTLPAPTNTLAPTNTPVIALGPTATPVFNAPMATIYAMRTQKAQSSSTPVGATAQPTSSQPGTGQPSATQPASGQPGATQPASGQPTARLTTTALPPTGIGEDMGAPALITAALILVVIIFLTRRLRTTA
jgi:hypothetical protein